MILNFLFNNIKMAAVTGNVIKNRNKFTILIGKNGTGKSQILKGLIEKFIDLGSTYSVEEEESANISQKANSLTLTSEYQPTAVIATSTSPFDRFPLPNHPSVRTHIPILSSQGIPYYYLGLRDLYSRDFSLSFLNRTIAGLIEAVFHQRENACGIFQVLTYLKYHGSIHAKFQLPYSLSKIRAIFDEKRDDADFVEYVTAGKTNPRLCRLFAEGGPDIIAEVRNAIGEVSSKLTKPRINLEIDSRGVFDRANPDHEISESLITLLKFGIFRLREVSLLKSGSNERFIINSASSGEQAVVLSFLGIGSYITDGALICIDEPEICLHPEWQEKYIELLISTFGGFNGCHFVIATHSPQILAKLENENCFVLDVETGETIDACRLNKRSADYQLANVFGTPGYKNEYLARELLFILTAISKTGTITPDQMEVASKILSLSDRLDQSDPVKKLMQLLKDSLEEIAQ